MIAYLGIDGGGTGCRAAVADASGRILGRAEAGPANIASDREGALANILSATRAAVTEAGAADPAPLCAALGLAGANASGTADWLRTRLPFARSLIVSDAVTAVKGALGEADGLVAAIGTGSVFAAQQGGGVRQIGGKGLILGDEGSGAWLGRRLLSLALRSLDGFAPALTPFLQDLVAELGGEAGVITFATRATPADFASLVPRLIAAEDAATRLILAEGRAEVDAALTLLHSAGTPREVVFLGGLGALYAGLLAPDWPSRAPLGTALDGALFLARGV